MASLSLSLVVLVCIVLLLCTNVVPVCGFEEFDPDHLHAIATTIKDHKSQLEKKGYTMNIVDQSLTNLPFAKKYKETFDEFYKDTSDCLTRPQETMAAYYLPVEEDQLASFFQSDLVKDFPKAVRNKLEILRFTSASPEKPLIFSDVFSRIFQDDQTKNEKFEVGNLVIKAFKSKKTWHILILSPSLINENEENCKFKKEFREIFLGKSQEVQHWLAIKAVQNKDFVNTLVDFDPHVNVGSEALAKLGYQAMRYGGEIVYKKVINMAVGSILPRSEL